LTGILFESPYIKGTLAKLGMQFHGDHRYEYKTALDTFTETGLTPAAREENTRVVMSWYGQIVRGIAEGRHMTEDQVRGIIDRGPVLGPEALAAHLVDGLAYRDEVMSQVKQKAGSGSQLLYFQRYLERAGRPHDKGKSIALIYGVGGVQRGKSEYDPTSGSGTMGSDTVSAAFRAAVNDKDVKAILFRVDSPGGSYVASDTIWREVENARKAGKPVIVSMGDLAGSGGYFVAMGADKIVAQPGTITASIGVLAGKMLTSGLWQKVGLNWDSVQAGTNATMWTGTHDYTPAEWQRFEAWLDRIYADFTTKVADGRHLPKEKVLEIAKGRIWSGEDAKNLGLIDELGGFQEALSLAKKAGGIPENEEVNLRLFPEKKQFWQLLTESKPPNSDREATSEALIKVMNVVQPVAQKLQMLGVGHSREVLQMPEVAQP
jgi:protease-4